MRCAALEIASAASAVRWFSFPPSPSASRTTDRATRRGINQSCYFPTLCSNQPSPRFSPPGSRGAHWKKGRVGHCPFYKIPSRTKKSCCFFCLWCQIELSSVQSGARISVAPNSARIRPITRRLCSFTGRASESERSLRWSGC